MTRHLLVPFAWAYFFCLSVSAEPVAQPVKIAIIGAGAAGSSSAYHLSRFASTEGLPIDITIFDRGRHPGGRSTTVHAYGNDEQPVELGASIFVQVNRILVEAVKEFNLSTSGFIESEEEISGADLGVWDGHQFVFVQQGSNGWWDIAKMLWRYGLAPVRTIRLMKSTVGKFLKMYDEKFPWSSLTEVVKDVGLLDVTASTGEQFMEQNGITGDFGHDIVQASTRVNYAQNLKYIHGLEAMVCMAAEGAMAVSGGNWLIFDNMVNASGGTRRMDTTVSRIRKQQNGAYLLTSKQASQSAEQTALFDSIILAAPYQYTETAFDPPLKHIPDKIPYVRLHVTLFTSPRLLSPTYFGLKPSETVPRSLLTTIPSEEAPKEGAEGCGSVGFWSISLLRSVENPNTGAREYLYKIFSPQPVEPSFINSILGVESEKLADEHVTWIYRKEWDSYPYEFPRVTFEEIRLDEDVWYTSGIESFISTMETSALMGKNVARLVVDQWRERLSYVDRRVGTGDEKHTKPEL